MKKLFLLLPLLSIPFLNGCNGDKGPTQLTFGSLIDEGAVQLSSSEFSTHAANHENFLLAIYPKDTSCLCWKHFSYVIDEAVSLEHLLIYKYYAEDVASNQTMKEIGGFNDRNDAPTFYIIKDNKIAKYYNYSAQTNFFKNTNAFLTEINNHIKYPKMFYINEDILDQKKEDKESFALFIARNACNDCNFVIPHTIIPYIETMSMSRNNLYVFDLQPYYGQDNYQEMKDKLLLSTTYNEDYGFGKGVVPTFQYYKEGELHDMCVYANDPALTYDEAQKCYFSKGSYYSSERVNKFHYLENVDNKDLTEVKIKEDEVSPFGNNYYWNIASSAKYYDQILTGFFDKYL